MLVFLFSWLYHYVIFLSTKKLQFTDIILQVRCLALLIFFWYVKWLDERRRCLMLQLISWDWGTEEIIICCHEISDEVMSLANSIKGQKSFSCIKRRRDVQAWHKGNFLHRESVDNKTFIYCKNNIYETKQKLYELEEILKRDKIFQMFKVDDTEYR